MLPIITNTSLIYLIHIVYLNIYHNIFSPVTSLSSEAMPSIKLTVGVASERHTWPIPLASGWAPSTKSEQYAAQSL